MIERLILIAGFISISVTVVSGEDKSQVNIEGLSLGYASDWIIKLAEQTGNYDLLEFNFSSLNETVPNNDIFVPDTTGFKMKKVTPPKVDEKMEKMPKG